VLQEIIDQGAVSETLRRRLAAEAFARTAAYDRAIADYFAGELQEGRFAPTLHLTLRRKAELRYGENPHQLAAVYREAGARGPSLVTARQLNGKELSYNNLLDLDSALAIVRSFDKPAVAVIKHNNPCGAATSVSLAEATQKALDGDPVSAFGSVLGFNRTLDVATAEALSAPGLFIEAIVAPDYEAAAVGVLTTKPKWKRNVRLMQVGLLDDPPSRRHYRYIDGGMLVQDADVDPDPQSEWQVVTEKQPPEHLMEDLCFGWGIVRHVKSNAIVLCQDESLCGVGAGQMSRVDSVEIAIHKAGARAAGSILASDAFFPFPDSIHRAAEAGITALIQPGGSVRDEEVIAACNERGLPMIFTGRRHFKH
jgi:phosphoribosylaminoimidazolecarboxamide formyltransferase/IMP cyclohydrolase